MRIASHHWHDLLNQSSQIHIASLYKIHGSIKKIQNFDIDSSLLKLELLHYSSPNEYEFLSPFVCASNSCQMRIERIGD